VRIALITGANKGIGLEIARQLAETGLHVILAARDADRGNAARDELTSRGLQVSSLTLDVSDDHSVEAAAREIDRQFGHLDILVNNAGIADPADGEPTKTEMEVVRRTFNTNFFGAVSVTRAMMPLLRKGTSARIINMSSSMGSLALNDDPASMFHDMPNIGYNTSKAALNMLTIQLNAELKGTSIFAHSICPGFVRTDLNGNTGHDTPAEGAREAVRVALSEGKPAASFTNSEGSIRW